MRKSGCNKKFNVKSVHSKWDDGSMTIIVNPGSDTPSRAVVVTEKFPVSREDHVRTDCWLSESVGKHYKGVWLSESVGNHYKGV